MIDDNTVAFSLPAMSARSGRVRTFALFLVLLPISVIVRAENSLSLASEPGDPIGDGKSYFFTSAEAPFYASRNARQGVSLYFIGTEHFWSLDFAAPSDEPLVPGLYRGAFRYPFQEPGEPGLSVHGDGRACDRSAGAFEVKEIEYGAGDSIAFFRATFEQHCAGLPPALTGEIRFESDTVVAVSAPLEEPVERRKNLTFAVSATEVHGESLELSATGLPAGAAFVDHGDGRGTFFWSPSFAQMGTHFVTFHAENSHGDRDASVTAIAVTGLTSLLVRSGPSDYPGDLLMSPDEFFFFARENPDRGVSLHVRTPSYDRRWTLDFAAPFDARLTVGSYSDAVLYPTQGPHEPGLSISSEGSPCSVPTGNFEVKEVRYGPHESIASFWSTFQEHCGGTEPALFGEIRFNANVIVEVTAPYRLPVLARHTLRFAVEAGDEMGGNVELTAEDLPPGASFVDLDDNTGSFRWTPTPDQAGIHFVTFHGRNSRGDEHRAKTRVRVDLTCPGIELGGKWGGLRYACLPPEPRRTQRSCSFRGAIRLTNEGFTNAGATWIELFLSGDESLGPDDVFLSRSRVGSLRARSYRNVAIGGQIPSGGSGEGKYVIAVLDATDGESECDEDDNAIARGPTQGVAPPR
jgi:hypothetical protein